MIRDFEGVYDSNSITVEYAISGTDNSFTVYYGGLNDWHVRRNGVRDEKLTEIMKRTANGLAFRYSAKDIAKALRAQYESEKPKKFETDTSVIAIYGSVVPGARVFGEEYLEVEKLTNFIRDSFRQLPSNKKFKVTFEEIK